MEDTTLRTLTLIQKTLDSKLEKSNDIKYFNTIEDIPIEDQTFFKNLIDNKLLIEKTPLLNYENYLTWKALKNYGFIEYIKL